MKLWLDDCRRPPFGYDLWAKTADEAIALLEQYGDRIKHCSLDHDLAEGHYDTAVEAVPIDRSKFKEKTGYAVLEWMHETGRWVADITVHTMNPVGGKDMMKKLAVHAPAGVIFRRAMP